MKNRKSALSIVEVMVVLLILVTGLVGVYSIFMRSIRVTNNLENKIQAIQIAREGIEAMINIRDTNWILFPLDKENCWITKNYNPNCFGKTDSTLWIKNGESYKIYRDSNGRWSLESPKDINPTAEKNYNYSNKNYRDFFKVNLNSNGLYSQTGGTAMPQNYTREIAITGYTFKMDSSNPEKFMKNKDNKDIISGINIKSIVRRSDSSSTAPLEVVLETTLANYKK